MSWAKKSIYDLQECSCEVTVVELAPEFIKKMSDAKVTAGEAAVLECRVGGQVGQVQWTKDGLTLGKWKDKDVT